MVNQLCVYDAMILQVNSVHCPLICLTR